MLTFNKRTADCARLGARLHHRGWHRASATVKRTVLLMFVATLGLIAFPGAAAAATSEADVYTDGTVAAKAWFNSGPNYFTLRDTKCDYHPVRIQVADDDWGSWYELPLLDSGCNTEANFAIPATINWGFYYRACRDDWWYSPPCGDWVHDFVA